MQQAIALREVGLFVEPEDRVTLDHPTSIRKPRRSQLDHHVEISGAVVERIAIDDWSIEKTILRQAIALTLKQRPWRQQRVDFATEMCLPVLIPVTRADADIQHFGILNRKTFF